MNILYLANSRNTEKPYQDASVRYRCVNPAQALSAINITADVTTVDMVPLDVVERYDLLVFHRPAMGRKMEKLFNRARQKKIVVVADYDDLIFNPDYAQQSPGYLNHQYTLKSIQVLFKKNFDALSLFDNFSVATTPLAHEMKKIRPSSHVTVIHNYLSAQWLEHNKPLFPQNSAVKRITYLPGSNSHHHDFELVEDLLCKFLSDHSDTVLRIVGPLNFKRENYNKQQLELMPHVPYPLLPALIRDSWVTIAPLAKNIFNNCKSGLKYFESAVFGIPVIASPIDDLRRLNSKALHLVDTPDQWLNALNLLSADVYYEQCAASGINHVKNHCIMSHKTYKEALSQYF